MSKPFNVIIAETQRLAQESSPSMRTKIKDSINRYYESVWNRFIWSEVLLIDETCTTSVGDISVMLPRDIATVFAITERSVNSILKPSAPYVYQSKYLSGITSQANPVGYTHAGTIGVSLQPYPVGTINVVSSSSADTTQTVRIYGLDANGFHQSNEVTLNGTSEVTTSGSFSAVHDAVKSERTVGTVTIKNTGGTNLEVIEPDRYSNIYIKIKLQQPADAVYTLYVSGKQRFRELYNDQDIPRIPIADALVLNAWAMVQQQRGKFQQATALMGEAEAIVSNIVGDRMIQNEMFDQSLPSMAQSVHDVPLFGGG